MKPYIVLSFAAAALVSLSACGQSQPEVVDNKAPDPIAARAAEAPPVEMPAAVKDSRSYRCKDNSVIYVDFLADDVSANLRTARDARSEEHTSELQSLMRISYAVFCLKKKRRIT